MTYKLKVLQQSLEQEEAAHKTTKTRLADKNKISESIEGAKSEAVKGTRGSLTKDSALWNVQGQSVCMKGTRGSLTKGTA